MVLIRCQGRFDLLGRKAPVVPIRVRRSGTLGCSYASRCRSRVRFFASNVASAVDRDVRVVAGRYDFRLLAMRNIYTLQMLGPSPYRPPTLYARFVIRVPLRAGRTPIVVAFFFALFVDA